MTGMQGAGAPDWLALFVMWAVMMVLMMLPSAAPVIRIVLADYRRRGGPGARVCAGLFGAGYLFAWTGFSALAATAQVGLRRAALLSPEMTSRSVALTGAILVAAGIYQWLPVKSACLEHCQSPLDFLMRHWQEGMGGAFAMGLRHGLFCVGCCGALMAVLFVVGVMNYLWIAALAAFVLLEKLAPRRLPLGRIAGLLLILWGTYEVFA
jgi:predicted metal-binding membrane protein